MMSKAAIIYWSGTGNTAVMASSIAAGMKSAGATVDVMEVTAAGALDDYEKIAFGCPSMGDEVLEEIDFEPFFTSVENHLSGKKVALFGSYGWGDGQWMRDWVQRTQDTGANLMGRGLIMQEAPDEDACTAYGKEFAAF